MFIKFLMIIFVLFICNLLSKCSILKVASGSMTPTLKVSDYIIIKKCDKYNVGDIITIYNKKCLITHRIVKEENGVFTTKGDYNNCEDDFCVTNLNIKGKVIYVIKNSTLKMFTYLFVLILIIYFFKIIFLGGCK